MGYVLHWPSWQTPGGIASNPARLRKPARGAATGNAGREHPDTTGADVTDKASKPLQVYVLEDSPVVQQLLDCAIHDAGAELSGNSADAPTAIGDVFSLQPDLILIDIKLASGSGLDVLKALQDHSLVPDATKVVLTHYADAECEELCVRLGADEFFDKSFQIPQARDLINALARERSCSFPRL